MQFRPTVLTAILLVIAVFTSSSWGAVTSGIGTYIPGQIILCISDDQIVLPTERGAANWQDCRISPEIADAFSAVRPSTVMRTFPDFEPSNYSAYDSVPPLHRIFTVNLSLEADVARLAMALGKARGVVFAEPSYSNAKLDTDQGSRKMGGSACLEDEGKSLSFPPDDTVYFGVGSGWKDQWNLHDDGNGIGCPTAWAYTTGHPSVRIGFLETGGVWWNHQDLLVVDGFRVIPGTLTQFERVRVDTTEARAHVTNCAGIATATTNNGTGIAGIAGGNGIDYGCEIVDIQLATSLSSVTAAWAQAIVWAADPLGSYHCEVISMSISTPNYSETLRAAVRFAHSVGVNIVCSNGNFTTPPLHYPSGYHDAWVTSVGAYDTSGVNIYSSDVGSSVDVLAPGELCPTTTVPGFADTNQVYQQQILQLFSATSCAAPHVAGSIALLRSYLGNDLNPEDYEWILKCSADDSNGDGDPQTWDEDYGHGLLRIGNALTIAGDWSINTYATTVTSVVDSAYVDIKFTAGPYTTLTPAIRFTIAGKLKYSNDFSATPFVWGTTDNPYPSGYHGYSAESPNYGDPFHEVITSSITSGSCYAKTYVYKMWNDQLGEYSDWYPAAPSQIPVAIVAMGPTTNKALTIQKIGPSEILSSPNPFNATVVFSFSVAEPGPLAVDVFNLRGQRVCQLFSDDVPAGPMTLDWHGLYDDGRPAASGTYILRMKSGKRTAVHKITLAK